MKITVTTAPTVLPITPSELKQYGRLPDGEDAILDILCGAAVSLYERMTERAYVNRTLQVDVDASEAVSPIILPYPPLVTFTSATEYDTAGVSTIVSATDYYTSGTNPARLVAQNAGWLIQRSYGALRLVYTCGYGTAASSVPADMRLAMLRLALYLYEHRDEVEMIVGGGSVEALPVGLREMAAAHRAWVL
jgi:uncharacterized phiE125 gp8 family phage protein